MVNSIWLYVDVGGDCNVEVGSVIDLLLICIFCCD